MAGLRRRFVPVSDAPSEDESPQELPDGGTFAAFQTNKKTGDREIVVKHVQCKPSARPIDDGCVVMFGVNRMRPGDLATGDSIIMEGNPVTRITAVR